MDEVNDKFPMPCPATPPLRPPPAILTSSNKYSLRIEYSPSSFVKRGGNQPKTPFSNSKRAIASRLAISDIIAFLFDAALQPQEFVLERLMVPAR
jgi:hypothetical protein